MTGIRDLAQHLGLSIGTVSRALNGKPDVNAKTRARVLSAARDLGYVPNQAGRSLRQGSSRVVGFVIESDATAMVQGDLFFIRVLAGMQSVLAEHDLNAVALPSPNNADRDEYLRRIVARRFTDGLVISSIQRRDTRILDLANSGIPFVTLGRSEIDGGQPWLDLDFEGIVDDALDRLTALGHTRIALEVPRQDLNLAEVTSRAFRDGLQRRGLPVCPERIVRPTSGEAAGAEMIRSFAAMPERPTALIFSDLMLPFGLYSGLGELGLVPGRDLSMVGLGTRLASVLSPRLTHYRTNLFELGQTLAETLLTILPGHRPPDQPPPSTPLRARAPFHTILGDTIQPPSDRPWPRLG